MVEKEASTRTASSQLRINPEKLAYWYLRLNGYLQIEDFYVHPRSRGSARTDADLIATRFPHRAEHLYDDPARIMEDDRARLNIPHGVIDIVIAEVKKGRCGLNGPWTDEQQQNIQRVLAAIGCIERHLIDDAAISLYRTGRFDGQNQLIRLVCFGRQRNEDISITYPLVTQIEWVEALDFIYERLRAFRHQKTQTNHWDLTGRYLKDLVRFAGRDKQAFLETGLRALEGHGHA